MGYTSKILSNSTSSLIAQQAVIATTSNNIANANTPGYARRTVNLETRSSESNGGVAVGNGVQVGEVTRSVDTFIDKLLSQATGGKSSAELTNQYLERLQNTFALDESTTTIGSALTDFTTAVNDLAADPASIALRTNLIERGNDLVSTIRSSYQTVVDLQQEADVRVGTEINTVNTLASQIAELNGRITTRESGGGVAADERDKREALLQKLGEKLSFNMVEDDTGAANIFLSKGFALVSGSTARTLEFTDVPSFASGSLPPSLGGGVLRHVVFDYNSGAGTSHIDLTQALQGGSGTIGALLSLRGYNDPSATSAFNANGTLVEIASRIESISRMLLTDVNEAYLGGVDENGANAVFDPTSGDLDGGSPSPYGLFDYSYTAVKDVDGNGLPSIADLAGTAVDNFTSRLQFAIVDPRKIAASFDSVVAGGSTNFAPGNGQNMITLATEMRANDHIFAVGSFSFTGSFDQVYQETVNRVSVLKQRSESDLNVATANLTSMQNKRDEVSGVSLDEEFTSLIQYQKAFQASARMIKIADDLLTQIVQLI